MEASIMNAVEVQTHAQKLFVAHGPKALAEAAQKVRDFEQKGEKQQAQDWKQIENALHQMRGPNAS
jgi:hypothetical protein